MSYKKYLIIISIILVLLFPDQIFSGLAGILVILIVLLLIIELALDVYIVIVYLVQLYKER